MPERKKMTQSEIVNHIAEELEFERKYVKEFFEVLASLAARELNVKKSSKALGGKAPGVFTIPYMGVQLKAKHVPKKPKRMGRNPATGEEIELAPKPAHWKLTARVLKKMKDAVGF